MVNTVEMSIISAFSPESGPKNMATVIAYGRPEVAWDHGKAGWFRMMSRASTMPPSARW